MKSDALLQAEQINRLTLELEALRFSTAGPNAELSRDLVKVSLTFLREQRVFNFTDFR